MQQSQKFPEINFNRINFNNREFYNENYPLPKVGQVFYDIHNAWHANEPMNFHAFNTHLNHPHGMAYMGQDKDNNLIFHVITKHNENPFFREMKMTMDIYKQFGRYYLHPYGRLPRNVLSSIGSLRLNRALQNKKILNQDVHSKIEEYL